MNKTQAIKDFKESYKDILESNDIPMKRMAWNDYVDSLNKNGLITDKQAATWEQPSFISKKK